MSHQARADAFFLACVAQAEVYRRKNRNAQGLRDEVHRFELPYHAARSLVCPGCDRRLLGFSQRRHLEPIMCFRCERCGDLFDLKFY